MTVILFNDISENNGAYNMDNDTNQAVAIRMSTGELMRFDHEASRNYANAIRTGKVTILYHYAGSNDPVQEAELFLAAVSPLTEGDIYCLDAELGQSREWKQAFIDHVRSKTNNTNPWDYMNQSTTKALGGPIDGCALWLAAPSWGFDEDIPGVGMYMAQQGPIVNGHDTNAFFGSLDQLKAYAYHALQPSPVPTPDPEPAPEPSPATPPVAPTPESEPTQLGNTNADKQTALGTGATLTLGNTPDAPTPEAPAPVTPEVAKPVVVETPQLNIFTQLLNWLLRFLKIKKG